MPHRLWQPEFFWEADLLLLEGATSADHHLAGAAESAAACVGWHPSRVENRDLSILGVGRARL